MRNKDLATFTQNLKVIKTTGFFSPPIYFVGIPVFLPQHQKLLGPERLMPLKLRGMNRVKNDRPGFESCLCHSPFSGSRPFPGSTFFWVKSFSGSSPFSGSRPFSGSSPTTDFTLVLQWLLCQVPGVIGLGTGWSGVSILWLGETESLICTFYLSVAAHTVWADVS